MNAQLPDTQDKTASFSFSIGDNSSLRPWTCVKTRGWHNCDSRGMGWKRKDQAGLMCWACWLMPSSLSPALQVEGGCHLLFIRENFSSHYCYGDFWVVDLKISEIIFTGGIKVEIRKKGFLHYMDRESCLHEALKTQRLLKFSSLSWIQMRVAKHLRIKREYVIL